MFFWHVNLKSSTHCRRILYLIFPDFCGFNQLNYQVGQFLNIPVIFLNIQMFTLYIEKTVKFKFRCVWIFGGASWWWALPATLFPGQIWTSGFDLQFSWRFKRHHFCKFNLLNLNSWGVCSCIWIRIIIIITLLKKHQTPSLDTILLFRAASEFLVILKSYQTVPPFSIWLMPPNF